MKFSVSKKAGRTSIESNLIRGRKNINLHISGIMRYLQKVKQIITKEFIYMQVCDDGILT
jgi:hypothetical protein